VLILRWYWWRINAWSEVSSMAAAFAVSVLLQTAFGLDSDNPVQFAYLILITVAVTTVGWLAVTCMTSPESDETLIRFYRRVHPSMVGWKRIAGLVPDVRASRDLGWNLVDWLCGCGLIYGALFGIGKIILKDYSAGVAFLVLALAAAAVIVWDLSRRGWSSVME
jgi:SSS family solute:Na+ symporter